MSGAKSSSRLATVKKDGSFRYATRFLALEKGKRNNYNKETNANKSCDCLLKSDSLKGAKNAQNSKLAMKKSNLKCCTTKDGRKKTSTTNHREKVVIVSKRSSSVSVVKSCNLRKSVSVKKVSYSTSVVLSSDEDTDSEEESEEEEKKECLRKKKTVLKHTTSKVKSSIQESKKVKDRSAKKAKAIRLLCDKLSSSNKHRALSSARELRPRFPYTMLQEWPTARTHRMASLNALAKVHVLYENEGRTVGENLNDADECSLIDFLNENSDDDDDGDSSNNTTGSKKESKPTINVNAKKSEKSKNNNTNNAEKPKNIKKDKVVPAKAKVTKRGKKRKLPDVEIIDTRICKRMASLNAQAILAASYLQEPKPKRISKKSEKCDSSDFDEILLASKCDIKFIKTEKEDEITVLETKQSKKNDKREVEILKSVSRDRANLNTELCTANKNTLSDTPNLKNWSIESEVAIVESGPTEEASSSRKCSVENSVVSSTAATKVGVTQYTEVTKVQINTHKDAEIKEESKSERKIEQILSNDDVAITQMYHYQSKSTNESYCVQMQTTYKPASRNLSPSASRPNSNGVHPYVNDPILPGNQHYYGRNSMLPSQSYQMNPNMGPVPPVVGIDNRLPRQYGGSAFTVPHYRHPQPMQFPPNEYGYYQPAGPLIQPVHDQCTIHKPVPYHPQPNPHQPSQRPQQPSSQQDGFQSFETRQQRQHKPALPSSIPPQQKPSHPPGPPNSENLSQPGPSSPQYMRRQPAEESRSRSLNHNSNSASFSQPAKHVRSPVMPTLYSSQHNFRNYQTQKRVPSTFRSYNQPFGDKEDCGSKRGSYDSPASFNSSHSNIAKDLPHESHHSRSTASMQPKDIPPHTSHAGGHCKNLNNPGNMKERNYGYKRSHGSSSNPFISGTTSICNTASSSSICNPSTSSTICHPGTSSSMCRPNTSPDMCHPGTSSGICHPNSSSNTCYPNASSSMCHSGSSLTMHHSNKSADMSNSGSFPNMYNADANLNMHHSDSSNFLPYHHNAGKDLHNTSAQDIGRYPLRPPSVIEIVEDNHRDTKTYIQLEVPKNSHREKIVVVDVEDDEIEKKHIRSRSSDKIKSPFEKPQSKVEPEKKCDPSGIDNPKQNIETIHEKMIPTECTVKLEKTEKVSNENIAISSKDIPPPQEKPEKSDVSKKNETPDIMFLEVKKKKESAVVRRARLHGKQRTFRDCYNRPLAQLSKIKKSDDISVVSEKHLAKKFQPLVSLPRLVLPKLEKSPLHGWSWEGTPHDKQVYISNEDPPCIRQCYPSIRHVEGDIICVRDCVFLRSGPRKTDLPFVAKVTALWENPTDGEMTMSLLWYYRPEHTETGKKIQRMEDEIFASKHRDTNSVACIEDKCFVLTYAEYCRYRRRCKMLEDNSSPGFSVVPGGNEYLRKNRLPPPIVSPDLVLFCRKVYDYRQKRLLKNPV